MVESAGFPLSILQSRIRPETPPVRNWTYPGYEELSIAGGTPLRRPPAFVDGGAHLDDPLPDAVLVPRVLEVLDVLHRALRVHQEHGGAPAVQERVQGDAEDVRVAALEVLLQGRDGEPVRLPVSELHPR